MEAVHPRDRDLGGRSRSWAVEPITRHGSMATWRALPSASEICIRAQTAPVKANPDSRAETNLRKRVVFFASQKNSILVLQCESFMLIKKEKGGDEMKIKVNVRAGGLKSRA